MHERECKGCISFNRGVNEFNRGVNELNTGVNELNRGVNHSVARQGCNLLRAAAVVISKSIPWILDNHLACLLTSFTLLEDSEWSKDVSPGSRI